MKHRFGRVVSTPAFGLALVITPVMLAGAVAAAPARVALPTGSGEVTPLAEAEPAVSQGAAVVAMAKPPADFRFASTALSAPPPTAILNSPGGMRIPAVALAAYRKAEQTMAVTDPGCGVSWNLLAGIGRIESSHANGGATDARGTAVRPIYGPVLDGSLPGNEIIVQSSQGGRAVYARAMGPMQFLPGTWSRYASDGDGDGKADPQNLFDAALGAARYLCSGGLNLRNQAQVLTAILRYNNSMPYAQNVIGWAAAYTTGVAPVDLPMITGPVPALGDAHLENREGLGPGMQDLPLADHFALLTAGNLGGAEMAGQVGMPPGEMAGQMGMLPGPLPGPGAAVPEPTAVAPEQGCEVICMASQLPPAQNLPPWMPPWMAPPPWLAPPPPLAPAPALPPPADAAPLPGMPAPIAPAPEPPPPLGSPPPAPELLPPAPGTAPAPAIAPGPEVAPTPSPAPGAPPGPA